MWDTHSGAGDFTVSNSSYFGFAHAIADSSGVSLVAQAEFLDSFNARGGNSNIAAAFVDSQFSLSQNASVTISWNFRDTVGSNLTIAGFSAMGSSDSIDLNLLENVTYDIIAQVSSIDSILLPLSGNETYITMTVNVVPLPTAAFAGLGMLAGLGAIRRSRK